MVLILAIAQLGFDNATTDRVLRIGLNAASLVYPFVMYLSSYEFFFKPPVSTAAPRR